MKELSDREFNRLLRVTDNELEKKKTIKNKKKKKKPQNMDDSV